MQERSCRVGSSLRCNNDVLMRAMDRNKATYGQQILTIKDGSSGEMHMLVDHYIACSTQYSNGLKDSRGVLSSLSDNPAGVALFDSKFITLLLFVSWASSCYTLLDSEQPGPACVPWVAPRSAAVSSQVSVIELAALQTPRTLSEGSFFDSHILQHLSAACLFYSGWPVVCPLSIPMVSPA